MGVILNYKVMALGNLDNHRLIVLGGDIDGDTIAANSRTLLGIGDNGLFNKFGMNISPDGCLFFVVLVSGFSQSLCNIVFHNFFFLSFGTIIVS
jgi:hypothetical protein